MATDVVAMAGAPLSFCAKYFDGAIGAVLGASEVAS